MDEFEIKNAIKTELPGRYIYNNDKLWSKYKNAYMVKHISDDYVPYYTINKDRMCYDYTIVDNKLLLLGEYNKINWLQKRYYLPKLKDKPKYYEKYLNIKQNRIGLLLFN
jgi:hypothetical protein